MNASLTPEEKAHMRESDRKTFISSTVQNLLHGAVKEVTGPIYNDRYTGLMKQPIAQLYQFAALLWEEEVKLRDGEPQGEH